ncbi:hypothetical protein HUW51_01830 [Adhaeribacter swui]|uniref:Lipocalin family protein n=1 Tax=Adhaeribacter swui TaxID=2086471 RepID=A0A7G7G2Z0_9BACT|nr:hypothetical protein [Adhaeribacter swui]QNF31524.1 hypothetical protein HUW51_01830 [Adhaeribacter swui]
MRILFFMSLLLGFLHLENQLKLTNPDLPDSSIQGRWAPKSMQTQYVVDSHLVHEEEHAPEKNKIYVFDNATVRVEYTGGHTVPGTYRIYNEDDRKKIVIQLPGTTATYNLIALTATSMVWQQDLDNTSYQAGTELKSAERAIYTQVFIKL